MGLLTFMSIVIALIIYTEANYSLNCPPIYSRYSEHHSGCQEPNPTCNILQSYLTEHDKDVILKEHNVYRSRLAKGTENKLPPAGNMLQMMWDDELAMVAQKYAEQCLFEHDCSNCRRVQNFAVGQNLAIEHVTNSPTVPHPNWPSAIKSWYEEINCFPNTAIDPYIAPPPEPTYGHFTQLVWAESWRIGCGYVLYKEGAIYKKLYVCNYGPAGNIVSQSVYKQGPPCSACPKNSCCDQTCGIADYPGLCKITDGKAPVHKPEGTYIFYCDFQNQSDCKNYVTGVNKWLKYKTLSGDYLGIVLNGGETTEIVFTKTIKPSTSSFCFVTLYRTGANVAGQQDKHEAWEIFIIPGDGSEIKQQLPDFNGAPKQEFSQFNMGCNWIMNTQLKVKFSVPHGAPPQFFEIKTLYATEGKCGNDDA